MYVRSCGKAFPPGQRRQSSASAIPPAGALARTLAGMTTPPPPRHLEYVPLDSIEVAKWNPKDHDAEALAGSMREHGYVAPMVLDDRTGRLVAGHGRRDELLRARAAGEEAPEGVVVDEQGVWSVAVVRGWRSRTDDQADRYVVADNRTTEAGGWKGDDLAGRLEAWRDRDALDGTGWTPRAADEFLAGLDSGPAPKPDPPVPAPPVEPVTQPGDVWTLGPHRLMCGDSRNPGHVATLMDGEQADLVFTSPPYNVNVPYEGHDDRPATWAEYRAFLAQVVAAAAGALAQGRAFCWNIGVSQTTYPHRQAVMLEDAGLVLHRQLVWQKVGVVVPTWHFTLDNPVVRQLTPNYQHEMVYVFAKGELERGGPAVIDGVLEHDVFKVNQAASTRDLLTDPTKAKTGAMGNLDRRAHKEHPAVFPLGLVRPFVGHLADAGAIVLDPFMGSGTTMLAAHSLGRRGYGMEEHRGYCDVACRRWQASTGEMPMRNGEPHDFQPVAP